MTDDPIETVIEENPEHVQDYHDGDEEALNFLVGQVVQETGGLYNPADARNELKEAMENDQ